MRNMRLYRRLTDHEFLRELGVRQATRHQDEDFSLARCQPLEFSGRRPGGVGWAAHILLDHATSYRGRQQRFARCDGVDPGHQLFWRNILQQEPTRSGAQRLVYVLIHVEGRQHQDLRWALTLDEASRRLDPVQAGHAHVHQHDVREQPPRGGYRLVTVLRFAHDLEIGFRVENQPEAGAHKRLIVGDEHAQAHWLTSSGTSTCRPVTFAL